MQMGKEIIEREREREEKEREVALHEIDRRGGKIIYLASEQVNFLKIPSESLHAFVYLFFLARVRATRTTTTDAQSLPAAETSRILHAASSLSHEVI